MNTILQALGIQDDTPTCIIACHDTRQRELNILEQALHLNQTSHKILRPYGGPIGISDEAEFTHWERQFRTSFLKAHYFHYVLIGHTGTCRHCEVHELFPDDPAFCEHKFWNEGLLAAELAIHAIATGFYPEQDMPNISVRSFMYHIDTHELIAISKEPSDPMVPSYRRIALPNHRPELDALSFSLHP